MIFGERREDGRIEAEFRVLETEETVQTERPPSDGISFVQRRLNASRKQYFDSADYFLKIHEIEKKTLSEEMPAKETPVEAIESLEPLEADRAAVPPEPLEKAYSEIIEEMKPKESV